MILRNLYTKTIDWTDASEEFKTSKGVEIGIGEEFNIGGTAEGAFQFKIVNGKLYAQERVSGEWKNAGFFKYSSS